MMCRWHGNAAHSNTSELEDYTSHHSWLIQPLGLENKGLFFFYILHFIAHIQERRMFHMNPQQSQEPVLLILDGHPSRYHWPAMFLASLFNIDILLLPPHTTHLLHPVDVSLTSALKSFFHKPTIWIDQGNIASKLIY